MRPETPYPIRNFLVSTSRSFKLSALDCARVHHVGLLDGAMHVWAVLYRTTRTKDPLYGKKSLESGRIGQIVYKYRASPTVRSIDFIIQCTIPKVPLKLPLQASIREQEAVQKKLQKKLLRYKPEKTNEKQQDRRSEPRNALGKLL
jgi:hypothetical protein